jgi:hypothetical protein
MSSWANPPTVIAGTTILAATWNAGSRDLLNVLRALTGGDPSGPSLALISIDGNSANWIQVPTAAIADDAVTTAKILNGNVTAAKLGTNAAVGNIANGTVTAVMLASGVAVSNIGYTPVNLAGDTMTDTLFIAKDTGSNQVFRALRLASTNNSNSGAAIRLEAPSGVTEIYHQYSSRIIGVNDLNGTVAFEIRYGESFARVYGNQIIDTTSIGAQSVSNASNLGGIAAANYARVDALSNFVGGITVGGASVITSANIASQTVSAAGTAAAISDGAVSTTAKIADGIITDAKVATGNKDGTTVTPSLRTLGGGSQQAAAGDHGHSLMARLNTGSYSGNSSTKAVTGVGFRPAFVLVMNATSGAVGGIIQNGIIIGWAASNVVGTATMDTDGFTITSGATGGINATGSTYTYVAVG